MATRICFTEADDALLEGGWPNQARLIDGHPHDKNPAKSALSWVAAIDPKYFNDWPREVAYRALRATPIVQFAKTNHDSNRLTKTTSEALAKSGAPSRDETKRLVFDLTATMNAHSYRFKIREYVFLAETILGADATLDALLEGFEASKPPVSSGNGTPMQVYTKWYAASTIAFLLLRAEKPSAFTKRIEAQAARFAELAKKDHDWRSCAEHLDIALHGASAVKAALVGVTSWHFPMLEYAGDDPDFVREVVAKDPKQSMTVRLVKIGGLEIMKGLTKRKFSAPELQWALRDFGMIQAPESVELILSMIGKSALKDAPMKWLDAHADYARPIVERSAKSGSAMAKAALAGMKK